MSEIITAFNAGWVHGKIIPIDKTFNEIIGFYLWNLPVSSTSSRSKGIEEYRWKKNVWKDGNLKKYLFNVAKLKVDFTYKKVTKLEEMSNAATAIGLDGNFQNNRYANRILIYNGNHRNEMLNIFYYIRCAFAHGRFCVYAVHDHKDCNESRIYALEAITRKRETNQYIVRARMILSEDTLLTWKKVIMDGPNKLSLHLEELYNEINNSILNVLENNVEELKKNDIADNLPYSSSLVNTVINNMRDSGMILYDNHKKRWVAV
ncbi:hypothetical protein [Lactimicrobium massiliense]|uniref:hypothetical protein n=1 Tax=Lactimicrobium massiliense TaxID=2161814 RepID=UPI000D561CDD|nr:hypothetical protein [Lactimicrobium massiliense]